jgi:hypothetical protein
MKTKDRGRRIEALLSGCQPAELIAGRVDGGEPAGGVEPHADKPRTHHGRPRRNHSIGIALCMLLAGSAVVRAEAPPPPAMAGGALMACPWAGACQPGIGYPLASWRSLFGGHGAGELLGIALKGTADASLGLGVAHVFWASTGASAPRASLALGGGFVMPLSGAGGLRTARPVAFAVLGVGGASE